MSTLSVPKGSGRRFRDRERHKANFVALFLFMFCSYSLIDLTTTEEDHHPLYHSGSSHADWCKMDELGGRRDMVACYPFRLTV
ncbi:hypothetical protein OUZ56_025257 [Daphnia magna]|uniref:Uncharacterized protein n=1 Tax=Daphnia magna TaxID=35525 RepID=A0ABQ9ZJB1_9CRUS|nr:hypothetical protein OUZ56_025257 [Daphnia magna]